MLSQHPAQPHQPGCTASTADYLILCLLTHLSLLANTAAKADRGLVGDIRHPLSAVMEVPHSLSMAVQPASPRVGVKNTTLGWNRNPFLVLRPHVWSTDALGELSHQIMMH